MSLTSPPGVSDAKNFSEGQVWTYQTRPGENGSSLLINKVEAHPNLEWIFHISVADVRVKNPRSPVGFTGELPHFPVSKVTLDQSCIEVIGHAPPNPRYIDGYNQWKSAFDQMKAGVFTISVAEIVGCVETALNK